MLVVWIRVDEWESDRVLFILVHPGLQGGDVSIFNQIWFLHLTMEGDCPGSSSIEGVTWVEGEGRVPSLEGMLASWHRLFCLS